MSMFVLVCVHWCTQVCVYVLLYMGVYICCEHMPLHTLGSQRTMSVLVLTFHFKIRYIMVVCYTYQASWPKSFWEFCLCLLCQYKKTGIIYCYVCDFFR